MYSYSLSLHIMYPLYTTRFFPSIVINFSYLFFPLKRLYILLPHSHIHRHLYISIILLTLISFYFKVIISSYRYFRLQHLSSPRLRYISSKLRWYAPQFSDNAITFKVKKKKYKFSSLGGILHISAKLQGGYL